MVKEKLTKKMKKILQDHAVLDHCNVCGIFPFLNKDDEEKDEIDCSMGFFKKVENPKIESKLNKNFETDVIEINGSRYSKEYIDNIKKMAIVWFSDIPEIFMMYDKIKKEFQKNAPVIFVFGRNLCFVLAPRLDGDDYD